MQVPRISYASRAAPRKGFGQGEGCLRGLGSIKPGFSGPPARGCQWIEGEPSGDDSCKCLKPSKTGFDWCEEHFKRVYMPAKSKLLPAAE
jgi:hypothetical protein